MSVPVSNNHPALKITLHSKLLTDLSQVRVNLLPHWYLHLFEGDLLVTILSPKDLRFELRDSNMV
jgi:hypothetical protein